MDNWTGAKSIKPQWLLLAAFLAETMVAGAASAAPSYTATVSGATAHDHRPENATANFTFDNSFTTLSLTLTNTAGTGQLASVSSVLDGIAFSFSGFAYNAFSLLSLSNLGGTVSCTAAACTPGAGVNLATSGWTYAYDRKTKSGLLSASNLSFKPYGIVNGNVEANTSITSSPHNPFLNGPVTFTFAIANPSHSSLSLSAATLYFGTRPDTQLAAITPSVPEPASYAFMLAGTALVGFVARRHRQQDGV